jgi:hypothetical protein
MSNFLEMKMQVFCGFEGFVFQWKLINEVCAYFASLKKAMEDTHFAMN